jgi:hypothetical protein
MRRSRSLRGEVKSGCVEFVGIRSNTVNAAAIGLA